MIERSNGTIFTKKNKKRPDGIIIISLFWTLTSIVTANRAVQTLLVVLPVLPHLSELNAPYSEVFMVEDLTEIERQWLGSGLPIEAAINGIILTLAVLSLIVIFGLFQGKAWSLKPAFLLPIFSTIASSSAVAFYFSAPFTLYFDIELVTNVLITSINLIWIAVIVVYLRKPNINQFFIDYEYEAPPPLPLSSLYPNTTKGEVLKTILMKGKPISWRELKVKTGLNDSSLKFALRELFNSNDILKIGKKYQVSKELVEKYGKSLNQLNTEIESWIIQWKELRNLEFSLDNKQFFLEGMHLDAFSKELISRAKSEVIVVNPFIHDCDLSNTLKEAKRRGIAVQIVTREPHNHKIQQEEYHSKLGQEGISLFYNKKVHAKLIIVDRAVAIISSMNFYSGSSAGVSWEAGLVSTDSKVVESTVKSVLTKFS